jgi:hypothetical protein
MLALALANGSSGPHLKAMRNELPTALKREGSVCYRKAGEPESGWLILDYSFSQRSRAGCICVQNVKLFLRGPLVAWASRP